VEKLSERAFLEQLVSAFPQIKEEVYDEDSDGLISLQVGCLTRYTIKAINDNKVSTALKCFRFVEQMLDKVNSNIESALVISLIGHLKFDKNPDLYDSFPKRLKELKAALDKHHKSFARPKKIKKKIKKTSKPAKKIRR